MILKECIHQQNIIYLKEKSIIKENIILTSKMMKEKRNY